MIGFNDFEGDLLLHDSPDGGEIDLENGFFVPDRQFYTAVYLSLFGGNKDDPGKLKNKNEWWGNLLGDISESEKLKSRFQHIITGLPMTVKNIKEAEAAAIMDLNWIIDDKIADEVTVYGQASSIKKINLRIEILKDRNKIFENTYSLLWEVGHVSAV